MTRSLALLGSIGGGFRPMSAIVGSVRAHTKHPRPVPQKEGSGGGRWMDFLRFIQK